MDKNEMLPCPFCGGLKKDHLKVVGRCIECQDCGASGPELLDADPRMLMIEWNTRTHHADIEEMARDAEKYRWLRRNWTTMGGTFSEGKIKLLTNLRKWSDATESDIDAVVESAMSEQTKENK